MLVITIFAWCSPVSQSKFPEPKASGLLLTLYHATRSRDSNYVIHSPVRVMPDLLGFQKWVEESKWPVASSLHSALILKWFLSRGHNHFLAFRKKTLGKRMRIMVVWKPITERKLMMRLYLLYTLVWVLRVSNKSSEVTTYTLEEEYIPHQ